MDAIFGFNNVSGISVSTKILGLYALDWIENGDNQQNISFSAMPELNDCDMIAICIYGGKWANQGLYWILPSCSLFSGPQIRSEIASQTNRDFHVYAHGKGPNNNVYSELIVLSLFTGGSIQDPRICFPSASTSQFALSAAAIYLQF